MNDSVMKHRAQKASAWLHHLLLLVLILTGLTLRVWNINFDRGIGTHPDERSTACFYAPSLGLPQSWEEFRDPRQSPLNPLWDRAQQTRRSFTYGHFPLYLGAAMGQALHAAAPLAERLGGSERVVTLMAQGNQPCGGVAVAGRLTMALLDTLTIFLLYLLGKRMAGPGVGLLAAAFYTFTAQAIQLAHFFAMDPASTTFTVLAVLGGVLMVQERTLRAACLTGIGVGLAVASKFSALPVLAVPVTAGILWFVYEARPPATSEPGVGPAPRSGQAASQLRAMVAVLLALLVGGLTFFVTSPYAVLDWGNFVQATLIEQGQMVRGVADFPFTRQYRNTTPYLYFIQQQVAWGLWWPLGILALTATLAMGGRLAWSLARLLAWIVRRRPGIEGASVSAYFAKNHTLAEGAPGPAVDLDGANIVVWSWVLPYFGLTGAFLAKFNRYMSPILPFVVLFGAVGVWLLWWAGRQQLRVQERSRSILGRTMQGAALAALLAALLGAMYWSAAYVNGVYRSEHTWITASRWVYENAPDGSVILWESWDDALPKTIPNEPGMDIASHQLRHIDWSPYEEDTAEQYAILKDRLREADYVIYSSKRIYDSVDELPERYPMTNAYYDAMWDGRLGFELAAEFTSPPALLGFTFPDRHADESWSLYDHPQVSIFRKTRQLSEAEFDAVLGGTWEGAIAHYRGADSPLAPFLNLLGLGSDPSRGRSGLVGAVVGLLAGERETGTTSAEQPDLTLDRPLASLPVMDDYRWNDFASTRPLAAAGLWWLALALLGWIVWPIAFPFFRAFVDRGYLLSRTLGWLLAGWLLWIAASTGFLYNSVQAAYGVVAGLALIGIWRAWRQRAALGSLIRRRWPLFLMGEGLFAAAYGGFILIRMANPDLWQPWFGGEKFMEFAFLNGILRSPTFPPVDPHFAGAQINYYYFGLYLVGFLIKLTGIYAEVAFNLAVPMLFALTVVNAYALAHAVWARFPVGSRPHEEPDAAAQPTDMRLESDMRPVGARARWAPASLTVPLIAPLFVAVMGNLDGFGQLARRLSERGNANLQSALPPVQFAADMFSGLLRVLRGNAPLPNYDFWSPSRVLPDTINEFPYWSFLFADLHPHLIGMPLSILFLAVLFCIFDRHNEFLPIRPPQSTVAGDSGNDIAGESDERRETLGPLQAVRRILPRLYPAGIGLWLLLGFLLGTLASVNLWELPTYFGVGVLALLMIEYRNFGRIGWLRVIWISVLYLASALLFFMPFFVNYENIGASGIGFVREGDPLGLWLLIWGALLFLVASWFVAHLYFGSSAARIRPRPHHTQQAPAGSEPMVHDASGERSEAKAGGVRWLGMCIRRFDRLPRFWYLHQLLVQVPTLGYLLAIGLTLGLIVAAGVTALLGRAVLGLCLGLLALGLPLLWQRIRQSDSGGHFITLLAVTGVALLAGTQVFYVKDFLQGGDAYRMNTLFKFFIQIWVLWGLAAGMALPRIWLRERGLDRQPDSSAAIADGSRGWDKSPQGTLLLTGRGVGRHLWQAICLGLVVVSFTYVLFGTPARLSQRMVGWRPDFGTLNGMAYMNQGSYTWPNDGNRIELRYDVEAIRWLLDHIVGNVVILESAEVDYYRAGGTRVASMTGLSGLRGFHASEQHSGERVGARAARHQEIWSTPDVARTQALIDELDVALIYVGPLERHQHPDGAAKFAEMAESGALDIIFRNEGVTIYAVPGRLLARENGTLAPVPARELGNTARPSTRSSTRKGS